MERLRDFLLLKLRRFSISFFCDILLFLPSHFQTWNRMRIPFGFDPTLLFSTIVGQQPASPPTNLPRPLQTDTPLFHHHPLQTEEEEPLVLGSLHYYHRPHQILATPQSTVRITQSTQFRPLASGWQELDTPPPPLSNWAVLYTV